ncbi:MAG: hypothetical protein ABIQ12_13140 [Opitutaceae bacterium]
MNSLVSRPARRAPRSSRARPTTSARASLGWIHDGLRHCVTLWPEIRFERESSPDEWSEAVLGEDVLASAALAVSPAQWRSALEFASVGIRELLEKFDGGRMAALHVVARCPELLPELLDLPALTPFLALHQSLRGGDAPAWSEISAVLGRDGVFGVLQWLGLPASRQTLAIFQHIAEPDLSRRLLEPLRAALWEPEAIWALSHATTLTDARIAEACHALAA